jgi:hypothetical protein
MELLIREIEAMRQDRARLEQQLLEAVKAVGALQARLDAIEATHENEPAPADEVPAEAPPEPASAPQSAPEPRGRVLTLVSEPEAPSRRLRAHSAVDRAERATAEGKLEAAVGRLLAELDARRLAVFEIDRPVRTSWPEAARTAAAKALCERDSRAAGWSAAVSTAAALDRRGELDATLERRFRELRRAHAYMLEGPDNARYVRKNADYPQPIGAAPDFVVVLREADRVIELADAWLTSEEAAEGLAPAALAAWDGLVSALRERKAGKLAPDRVAAMQAAWVGSGEWAPVRAEAYRTFRGVLQATPMNPFQPSDWHRAQWGQHWRQAVERVSGEPDVALPTQQAAR